MQEMKYFNEGNDCDICKNQLMTGRDGTVEDCRRRQNGLSCRFEERDIRTCPVCEHEVDREDMYFTKDCHGIPFRLVCDRCYQRIMSKGYDGEYYTEADEQIEDDYSEPKRAAVARLCGMTAHALTRQVRTGGQTDGSRTYIANRGSSHIECITAIHPNSDAARETPYRNSGADVINMDLSHFGETACRLFRKRHTGRT